MVTHRCSELKLGSPSFLKVVRHHSYLRLPPAFVRRYSEKIPKNPTLKTTTGNQSWKVKMEKMGEDYCFTHGWEKLVEDTQLRITDVLVFWLIDPFTFIVAFYDADGCEKDLKFDDTNEGEGGDDEDEDDDLGFQRVITEKTHKYTMPLPKKFIEAAGLENKTSITLKDHEGKAWMMGLLVLKYPYSTTKYSLSTGWSVFRQYHNLDGDICSFKFSKKEGALMIVQLLKAYQKGRNDPRVDEGVKTSEGRPWVRVPGGGVEVKTEYESSPDVAKKKKGRPTFEKRGGVGSGVNVKIEDESGTKAEVEVVKRRKRGRPQVEKRSGGGGVDVKVEDESGPETAEAVKGRPLPPPPPRSGGVSVKIEDESEVVVKRKRGRLSPKKPTGGGVDVKVEAEVVEGPPAENCGGGGGGRVAVERKRGRPRLDKSVKSQRVIFF